MCLQYCLEASIWNFSKGFAIDKSLRTAAVQYTITVYYSLVQLLYCDHEGSSQPEMHTLQVACACIEGGDDVRDLEWLLLRLHSPRVSEWGGGRISVGLGSLILSRLTSAVIMAWESIEWKRSVLYQHFAPTLFVLGLWGYTPSMELVSSEYIGLMGSRCVLVVFLVVYCRRRSSGSSKYTSSP